ncbi:MAG: RNA methyltransferase [Oricola sp.]
MSENNPKGSGKDSHYARLRRAHREANPPEPTDGRIVLYGLHSVKAAMENPSRRPIRLLATRNAFARLELRDEIASRCPVEIVDPKVIDRQTGEDAVHQGVALEAWPLKPKRLDTLGDTNLVLVLDQVTDPHNVGAILRSAVAFDAGALVTTARHSPVESGVLAKAASGALEHIDHIEVRNLAEALESLAASGFQTIGLDSEGPDILEKTVHGGKIALVLGAEGKGLRQKTRETVNALARLDMPGAIRSLNVSNAAALSLYVARSHLARVKDR